MPRRNTNLNADVNDLELAKAKGINLSKLFRNSLKIELSMEELNLRGKSESEQNAHLKTELARFISVLEETRKRAELAEGELLVLKKKYEGTPERKNETLVWEDV